jgi:integrase
LRLALSPEQIRALLEALPDRWRPVFEFQFELGCRVGEALNLTWNCIDIDKQIVHFRPHELPDGSWWQPKSDASIRDVKLGEAAPALDQLLALHDNPTQFLPNISDPVQASGLIFFPGRERPKSYRQAQAVYKEAARKVGLKSSGTHDLRRARICQALASGVDPNYLAAAVGHASLKTTLVYAKRVAILTELPPSSAEPVVGAAVGAWKGVI